jgi:hypothetical protein
VRLPSLGTPFLDLYSAGRVTPQPSSRFTPAQIEQIRRTVRRVPEVMVKVTGGGRKVGAVAAHLAYISHHGERELETDDGRRVSKEWQKELLQSWHLELSAGQYREQRRGQAATPGIKLVHNITLSMPAPTPSEKVLAAAKAFASEKFGARHHYAMALHTHQQHPHVHLVVKAEGFDGRRLHIDKAMLREWRQDFARMMREQGIAANATPRAIRGQTKRGARDARYQAKRRGSSHALQQEVGSIAAELARTRAIRDPARPKLLETRKAIITGWNAIATRLEAQGEIELGGDVRYFAAHLPAVLTDRERLAAQFILHWKAQRSPRTPPDDWVRDRAIERSR